MQVKIEQGNLIIELPIVPHPSKTGKTIVIATSAGNQPTTCQFQGQVVTVGVNAYIKK